MGYLKITKWQLSKAFGRLSGLREKETGWDISLINIYLKCFSHSAGTKTYQAAYWLIGLGRKRVQKWFSCSGMASWSPQPERQAWKGFSTTDSARSGAGGSAAARPSSAQGRRAGCADQEGSDVAVMGLGESTEQQTVVESWHCLLESVLWERDTPGTWRDRRRWSQEASSCESAAARLEVSDLRIWTQTWWRVFFISLFCRSHSMKIIHSRNTLLLEFQEICAMQLIT